MKKMKQSIFTKAILFLLVLFALVLGGSLLAIQNSPLIVESGSGATELRLVGNANQKTNINFHDGSDTAWRIGHLLNSNSFYISYLKDYYNGGSWKDIIKMKPDRSVTIIKDLNVTNDDTEIKHSPVLNLTAVGNQYPFFLMRRVGGTPEGNITWQNKSYKFIVHNNGDFWIHSLPESWGSNNEILGIKVDETVQIKTSLKVDNTINAGTVIANSYSCSDKRYKKEIVPLKSATQTLQKLQGVSYTWKKDNKHDIGLIAQDVEKVLPELVYTDSDGYKALAYSKLTAVLIEAVKEQEAKITDQEVKLSTLESENRKLKNKLAQIEKLNSRLVKLERLLADQSIAAK